MFTKEEKLQTYKVVSHDIPLGHRWEHYARRIEFDISAWVDAFGPGTVQLLHQRQGDEYPYPVTVTRTDADGETVNNTTGTLVRWDVTNTDTAQVCRYGKAELRYYRGTQVAPEFLAKSDLYRTTVENALGGALATPPEESPGWLETILDAANRVNDVDDSLDTARGYAESAAQSATNAATESGYAQTFAQEAQGYAEAAAQYAASTESTAALPAIYRRGYYLWNGITRLDGIQYIANDGATVGVQATVPLSVTTTATGNPATGWTNLSDATITAWFENDGVIVSDNYAQTLDSGNHILNLQTFFTVYNESAPTGDSTKNVKSQPGAVLLAANVENEDDEEPYHTLVLAFAIIGGEANIPAGTIISLSGAVSFTDGSRRLVFEPTPVA